MEIIIFIIIEYNIIEFFLLSKSKNNMFCFFNILNNKYLKYDFLF